MIDRPRPVSRLAERVLLSCAVLVAGLFGAPEASAEQFELRGNAERGASVYTTYCAPCHGENGNGRGPLAPAMNPAPTDFTDRENMFYASDESLYKVTRDGGQSGGSSPLMLRFQEILADAQIRDVIAHVRTFTAAKK